MVYSTFSESQDFGIVQQWEKYELSFLSDISYKNPLYEVNFHVKFTSPTGQIKKINGFWDGGGNWKARFMPSEIGEWHYKTICSDTANRELNGKEGVFRCERNTSELAIFQKGPVTHADGDYHLKHEDGTPFLWIACTAWNGTLKSTNKEWEFYLKHRAEHHYSVIQFVATPWRGCDMNSQLQTAYTGSRRIHINPTFFQHLDQKIDQINAFGLVAAPVLLWALPYGKGKELSPGYQLPQKDAILLAKYMVARYGGHHVIWILGGDGLFVSINESRWKNIARNVFADKPPGVVAMHPMGKSWIGDAYADEKWLNIIGYQSGHNNDKASIEFITKGPAARKWSKLPPRPIINMEPCYEEIHHKITGDDVRLASYWSLFATPVAGITYGANGIWPWIRKGEKIMNHGSLADKEPSNWKNSLDLPGSKQISYLAAFVKQFAWYELKPHPTLLAEQPGDVDFKKFVSIVRSSGYQLILAYVPANPSVKIYNPASFSYQTKWFNPKEDAYYSVTGITNAENDILVFSPPVDTDLILILKRDNTSYK